MNLINRLIIAVVFSALVAVVAFWPGGQDEVVADTDRPGKVVICHIPPGVGYTQGGITLLVGQRAADAHLAQHPFDHLGPC